MIAANKKDTYWNELGIIDQVYRIVDAYNKIKHPYSMTDNIHLQAAYPDYIFDKTSQANVETSPHLLICYDVIKKEDGSYGENTFSNTKKPRPVLMETKNITLNEGQNDEREAKEEIYTKRYDLTFRFDCMAPTDTEALRLTWLFERMMEIHAEYLERGCHRWIYIGRKPSYFNRETKYRSRSCEFFAQVEEQWHIYRDKIQEIKLNYLNLTQRDMWDIGGLNVPSGFTGNRIYENL